MNTKILKKSKNQNFDKFDCYLIMKIWNVCWTTLYFSCNTAVGVFKKGCPVNDAYYNIIIIRINFNELCMEKK